MRERVLFDGCPLCSSKNFKLFHVGDCSGHFLYNSVLSPRIVWNQCGDCDHVFTEGYYTDEACKIIFSKTHENQKLGYQLESGRAVSSRMIDKVLPYAADGVWLDVGFGNGSLLFAAEEYGFKPIGLDLREENVVQLKSLGIESYCKDLAELEISEECSVISMMDVLEHIPYPHQALKSAKNLLREGGVLFLSMPNSENLLWRLMTRDGVNPYWGEIEHYHNFSRSRLYDFLQSLGFEPVRYGVSERYRVCMEVVAIKK